MDILCVLTSDFVLVTRRLLLMQGYFVPLSCDNDDSLRLLRLASASRFTRARNIAWLWSNEEEAAAVAAEAAAAAATSSNILRLRLETTNPDAAFGEIKIEVSE